MPAPSARAARTYSLCLTCSTEPRIRRRTPGHARIERTITTFMTTHRYGVDWSLGNAVMNRMPPRISGIAKKTSVMREMTVSLQPAK